MLSLASSSSVSTARLGVQFDEAPITSIISQLASLSSGDLEGLNQLISIIKQDYEAISSYLERPTQEIFFSQISLLCEQIQRNTSDIESRVVSQYPRLARQLGKLLAESSFVLKKNIERRHSSAASNFRDDLFLTQKLYAEQSDVATISSFESISREVNNYA